MPPTACSYGCADEVEGRYWAVYDLETTQEAKAIWEGEGTNAQGLDLLLCHSHAKGN
jgi:hypothetical protein